MKDWISQLADSEKANALEKKAQIHRATIRAAILPSLYERLIEQVRKDIDRCTIALPPERRLTLVYPLLAGNFLLRKQRCYPLVDLSVEPREGVLIKFTYQYRRTDTSETKEWGDIIRCEIDSADMAMLSCGDRKFIDERELSRFLLEPLVDANFIPPGTV